MNDSSETATPEPRHLNSVDATTGQPIVQRVMARKAELEALLAALPETALQSRSDINLALFTVGDLLTGDLTQVPQVVAAELNRWLERHKHLEQRAPAPG